MALEDYSLAGSAEESETAMTRATVYRYRWYDLSTDTNESARCAEREPNAASVQELEKLLRQCDDDRRLLR